jgi:2-oxo-4-hydroxy-4-carboxy-5-ureidoimidazoline decarboxylase
LPEPHAVLNALATADARLLLSRCCGSTAWIEAMLARRPFASTADLHRAAEEVWGNLSRADFLEAFSHHPPIGADLARLAEKFATTHALSSREQAGMVEADRQTLAALRDGNLSYQRRFGFIFIVCATGKTAGQMLALLLARMENDAETELRVAAGEQAKITKLRLEALAT